LVSLSRIEPRAVGEGDGREVRMPGGEPARRPADADEARVHRVLDVSGAAPGPHVAQPQVRQQVQDGGLWSLVAHGDPHGIGVRALLGVVGGDREVAVLGEDPGVDEFEFGLVPRPRGVRGSQGGVGELGLRVVVAPGEPGAGRGGVLVPPVVLGVLAVVALGVGEPEGALLEDRVAPVPEGEGEAPVLVQVREPGEPVLAPAVDAGARVVEREVRPRVATGAVVLADTAPGALRQVRAPVTPGNRPVVRRCQSLVLGILGHGSSLHHGVPPRPVRRGPAFSRPARPLS
jgi:hypothetical protein